MAKEQWKPAETPFAKSSSPENSVGVTPSAATAKMRPAAVGSSQFIANNEIRRQ